MSFDLEGYLAAGMEDIMRRLLSVSSFSRREAAFMARYARSNRKATALRHRAGADGEHIPPFLIASITDSCNLHCAGCYARELQGCGDSSGEVLSPDEWKRIFAEARDMGVSFILLAGGEPLLRPEILDVAAQFPEIIFPVFTNGTLLFGNMARRFDEARNLLPVLSLEGDEARTDARRGRGVTKRLEAAMRELRERRILFGASVTVTKQNLTEVTSDEFLAALNDAGCRGAVYVEFVPTDERLSVLAPGDGERRLLNDRLNELRTRRDGMLLLAFPGDELSSGGCLAAGRGFFHINARGGAEPCPFSPYSDANLRDMSLREALNSPLFRRLRGSEMLTGAHEGGCVLFSRKEEVEELLAENL